MADETVEAITPAAPADTDEFIRSEAGVGPWAASTWAQIKSALTAADIAIVDSGALYAASEIEAALAEVKAIADAVAAAGYWTKTAEGDLSDEFAMGSLATGLVKNTTTTGVPTIAAAGTDYQAPVWTDADPVLLETTTRDVVIGAAQQQSAKFSIDGDADQVLLAMAEAGTHTAALIKITDDDGTNTLMELGAAGSPLSIGFAASATNTGGIALSDNSSATGTHSIAIGNASTAGSTSANIALGDAATATSGFSVAIGFQASATTGLGAWQLGVGTNTTANSIQFRDSGAVTATGFGFLSDSTLDTDLDPTSLFTLTTTSTSR
jgi:hypothetical protein